LSIHDVAVCMKEETSAALHCLFAPLKSYKTSKTRHDHESLKSTYLASELRQHNWIMKRIDEFLHVLDQIGCTCPIEVHRRKVYL